MTSIVALRVAAALGFLAVALGAFGAHGLRELLERHATTAIWEKAAFYHLVHAVLLTALALYRPLAKGPWLLLLIGVLIFSGSLYLLALTGHRWLGAVTPLGGLALLAGWLLLAFRPPV